PAHGDSAHYGSRSEGSVPINRTERSDKRPIGRWCGLRNSIRTGEYLKCAGRPREVVVSNRRAARHVRSLSTCTSYWATKARRSTLAQLVDDQVTGLIIVRNGAGFGLTESDRAATICRVAWRVPGKSALNHVVAADRKEGLVSARRLDACEGVSSRSIDAVDG